MTLKEAKLKVKELEKKLKDNADHLIEAHKLKSKVREMAEGMKADAWDETPSTHGFTNGLIMAAATLEGVTPELLPAPDRFKKAGAEVVGADRLALKELFMQVKQSKINSFNAAAVEGLIRHHRVIAENGIEMINRMETAE